MNSILEELCRGNINPSERSFRQGSVFDCAAGKLSHTADVLLESLDETQKGFFQAFEAARDEVQDLENIDKFIYGFRLGLLIGLETAAVSDEFAVNGQ